VDFNSYVGDVMDFGIGLHRFHLLSADPQDYVRIVSRAEQLGFQSIWMGDHLVMPRELPDKYRSSRFGATDTDDGSVWLDPMTTFAYLAHATERIRFCTDIWVLPLRNPFVTAKLVATVDLLSRGRVALGVGVGWLADEFAAVGEDFTTRGRRCDEIIQALRILWEDDPATFHGHYYAFDEVRFLPKPAQRSAVPIFYGGTSSAALRRAGTLCDGWIDSPTSDVAQTASHMSTIERHRQQAGREGPFEFIARPGFASDRAKIDPRRYEDIGVTTFLAELWPTSQRLPITEAMERLESFATANM
jgi:probable F420-dependent oxidoreductase